MHRAINELSRAIRSSTPRSVLARLDWVRDLNERAQARNFGSFVKHAELELTEAQLESAHEPWLFNKCSFGRKEEVQETLSHFKKDTYNVLVIGL